LEALELTFQAFPLSQVVIVIIMVFLEILWTSGTFGVLRRTTAPLPEPGTAYWYPPVVTWKGLLLQVMIRGPVPQFAASRIDYLVGEARGRDDDFVTT
jgi:hypothetical protein